MDNTFRRRRRTTITHRRLRRRLCLRSGICTAGAARSCARRAHHTLPIISRRTLMHRSHRTAYLCHPPKDIPFRRTERITRTPLRTPVQWHTTRCLCRIHLPYSSHRTPDRHGREICSTRSSFIPDHTPPQDLASPPHKPPQHHMPARYLGRTPSRRVTPSHNNAPSTPSPAPSPQHHTPTRWLGHIPSGQVTPTRPLSSQTTPSHRKATPSHRSATMAQSTAPCRPTASPRTQAGSG